MNKFEKQLEKWNKGVLRGAQAKLAKTLGVSSATTAQWATGKRHPSKGYVAQMAGLFNMDVFGVLKLFDPRSTTYPDLSLHNNQARALRDRNMTDCSYNAGGNDAPDTDETPAQSNSVTLPFLTRVPLNYPEYDEADVIEWWSVPRRYALGAKYIVRCSDAGVEGAADPDDLCLVKPGAQSAAGQTVLFAAQNGACITRKTKGPKNKEERDAHGLRPLGVLTRRICGF